MGNGHSAIDRLIALTTLRQYQNGGQVLQIPQKKELDIVWPVDGESPEDMEQAKYNPVTQLYWKTLLDEVLNQSRSRQFKDSGAPIPPRSYLDEGQSPEEHPMFRPPRVLEPGPSPEDTEDIMQEIIKKFKDVQLGRGFAKSGGLVKDYQEGGEVGTAEESFERFWKNYYKPSSKGEHGEGPNMNVSKELLYQAWKESGSPYIKEMDLEGFKKHGITYEIDGEEHPRAFFQTATPERHINLKNILPNIARSLPGPAGAAYRLASPRRPITEWQRVPTDTTYIQPGNLDELISELAHAGQFAPKTQEEIWEMDKRYTQEMEKYGDVQSYDKQGVYGQEGTIEHEAHSVREPALLDYIYGRSDKLAFPQ